MGWIVVTRNYHGKLADVLRRWVVHREGEVRGICECWRPEDAQQIADALNNFMPMLEALEEAKRQCEQAQTVDDLNVLHRIVCGMDENTLDAYWLGLEAIVTDYADLRGTYKVALILKATPAQIREAILRAYGKWEQDND